VEVMVAGGKEKDSRRSSEIYNTTTDTWRRAASFELPAFGSGMAVLDGKPTLMGGYDDDATPRNQNKVIQYSMETDTWTELDQKLQAGRHHILTIPVPRQVFCPTQKLSS